MPGGQDRARCVAIAGLAVGLGKPGVIGTNDTLASPFFQIFQDWLKRHFSPPHLFGVLFIGRNERREIRACHHFKSMLLRSGVMTSVVSDFVKDGTPQKVSHFRRIVRPTHFVPTEPVADLRIPNKQYDAVSIEKFKRENETRIVGAVVKLDCKIGTHAKPVIINATPRLVGLIGIGGLFLILFIRFRQLYWSIIRAIQKFGGLFCLGIV